MLPARVREPQDKALVEITVKLVYTRIYLEISKQVFYSLEELNAAIRKLLDAYNKWTTYSYHGQYWYRQKLPWLCPRPPGLSEGLPGNQGKSHCFGDSGPTPSPIVQGQS